MKFIPIIGTISAGKTAFLRAFLGIDVLQTGSVTTTKFVCLIKNSTQISFYHVIPKKEQDLIFVKVGPETKSEEKIKQKIIEINTCLKEKKGTKDDIFYMLEFPIKNIENIPLLENCYFMDIPGLNEKDTNYINDIFSLITLNEILLEIVIFDSTSIGSDNILNIFTELEKKKCLCKKDNIFILNKIDLCTGGSEENIVEGFKKYFYETFEDEKDKNRFVNLNIYDNHFIPMNSILYRAETKLMEDFSSLLIFEMFYYLENETLKGSSFFEYLQKRISLIIEHEKIDIDKDMTKIDNNYFKNIAEDSVAILKNTSKNIKNATDIDLGINLKKKSVEKELKKLFAIQKNKKYLVFHSEFFTQLQEVVKNIKINQTDLSCPPNAMNPKILISDKKEKSDIINVKNDGINIIEQLDNFLNETFKLIDPQNELKEFKISLQTLRENILGRKIRISLIGNISVGKSSVLNCIIGYDILPTKNTECTYRGVIIRHKKDNNFKLYRTKLITRGKGLDQYYYFIDESKWYCNGIPAIKDYLNNKNNDKKIGDEDAYIVITGPLKIFDFIKLDDNIINKIEFIDLPGADRKNNTFNDKEYYKKILKFSNCCLYMNDPKTIDDKDSEKRMLDQYSSDKSKIFTILRKNFIKTCLFLINKSDTLENEREKREIVKSLFQTIKKEEKKLKEEELNVAFFSSKFFLFFLNIYNQYVIQAEENPYKLLKELYQDWAKSFTLRSWKSFIIKKIETLQDKLDLDSEEEIEPTEEFQNNLSFAMDKLFEGKFRGTSQDEEDDIIRKLYTFNHQLQVTDFNDTHYSHLFFDKLKEVILFCDNFQNESLKFSILEFFTYTDQLFDKEISKENEQEKEMLIKRCELFQTKIIPSIELKFEEKKKTIMDILELGLFQCQKLIDEEIKNADKILEEANKDIEAVAKNFEKKIDEIISRTNEKKEKQLINLTSEIESVLKEEIESFYSIGNVGSTKVDLNKGITLKMVFSLVGSAISGIAVRTGLVMVGQSLLVGTAAATGITTTTIAGSTTIGGVLMGPLGIAIGIGVGLTISVVSFLVHYFSKTKRYVKGLEQTKIDITKKFDEIKEMFMNDFTAFQNSLSNELKIKVEIMRKQINTVNENKWKAIKEKYLIQKKAIEQKIKSFK